MSFTPTTILNIRGNTYRFVTNAGQQIEVNGTGSRAAVYQIQNIDTGEEFALKVFKDEFQHAYHHDNFAYFQRILPNIPAFAWVRQRILLNKQDDKQLIMQFPELQNAIIMPWFNLPQVDLVRASLHQKSHTSMAEQNTCKQLGQLLADTLAQLEQLGIAHGDIASSNVLIDWKNSELYIIDIEDMYHASLNRPITTQHAVGGTNGYRFNDIFSSWQSEADRFAGAILICELLTMASIDPTIPAAESYFHQDDLDMREFDNENNERFNVLYDELLQINNKARSLFKQAWLERNITKLPTLQQWSEALGKPNLTNIYQRWTEKQQHLVEEPSKQSSADVSNAKPEPQPKPQLTRIPYQRVADSDSPVLFVYLLDLSRSMFQHTGQDGRLRFDIALDLINTMNLELLQRSRKIGGYRPRYHVSVIGYHKRVCDLLTPYHGRSNGENNIKKPANTNSGIHPIGTCDGWKFEYRTLNRITPIGGDYTLHADGETHMTQAFSHVRHIIQSNISTYQDSHPPYVFHITDGANNDNGNLTHEFKQLTNITTNYGNTLVSTAYIGAPLINPIDKQRWNGITSKTKFIGERAHHGEALRKITSLMPSTYHNKLVNIYPQLSDNAYLFFPGTDEAMLKLALATSKATGEK